MMTIANPIYDTVFKYLMEDSRIARTILSALLKENIVEVEMRPHEYTNGQKESLSIFRIDFGATVMKPDGEKQLILIELQKSWLPTETLRFRQYLGVHYQNPKNIVEDSPDHHAIPMVAVYLLGHTVGDVADPVVYVHHETRNYNGEVITQGMPNPFIDSLNHDSIIVQIPRLHGKINNRLDKVLSVFDQSNVSPDSEHFLCINDGTYEAADDDMQPILHRLMMAAANVKMRQDMNVEDEYYSIIKTQEGKLYGLEHELAKKKKQLAEKVNQLAEKVNQLAEKDGQLAEKDDQLKEKDGQLAEKDSQLKMLVKMLMEAGQSIDAIAANLHVDTGTVKKLMGLSGASTTT